MHGTVTPIGDAFWSVNYPPNGFRCHCRAEPVSETEYAATPPGNRERPQGWQDAPDTGWRYNVGSAGVEKGYAALTKKFEALPPEIAKGWMKSFVQQPAFEQFIAGNIKGNFPVAVLDETARVAIGAESQTAWLSDDSLSKNKGEQPSRSIGHAELTVDDYRQLPSVIGDPLVVIEKNGFKEVFAGQTERYYLAVVKMTKDKTELFVQSFRRASVADIRREMKKGTVLIDRLGE
jgi:hypothetical protein